MQRKNIENNCFMAFHACLAGLLLFAYFGYFSSKLGKEHEELFAKADKYKPETFINSIRNVDYYLIKVIQLLVMLCLVIVIMGFYQTVMYRRLLKNPVTTPGSDAPPKYVGRP